MLLRSKANLSSAPPRLILSVASLVVFSFPAWSQQILEDWNCGSGAIPTAGNPTLFTCPGPHNFVSGTYITVWNASGGSWANLNTQSAYSLRQSTNSTSTTPLLVNDTQFLPQSGNFAISTDNAGGSSEQILVNVASADTLNVVTRGYNGTTPANHAIEEEVWGPLSAAVSYPITITGTNTFTVPFDSTGYGTYSGNPILLQRSSFTYTSAPASLEATSVADGVGQLNVRPTANGNAVLVIPGCTFPSYANQSAAYECARGYTDPANQKGYGGKAQVSNLVVSGGTGVVTLAAAYSYNGQEGNRTLGPNQLIWLQGMNEGSNAFNSINRPWIMESINAGMTQITIPGMGGQGVADGTYTPSITPNNFRLQPPQSLYYYFYGDDTTGGVPYPTGYIQQQLKHGPSFNNSDNRVQMYICWGKTFSSFTAGAGSLELGNYFFTQPSGTAYHGYQTIGATAYANQCGIYVFTANFQHLVGQSDPTYNPDQWPNNGNPGYPSWTGETGYGAWQIMAHWYLNGSSLYADFSNQTVTLGQMTMNYVASEPEEYVITRSVNYTGSGYEVDLESPDPGIASISYQYRWSNSDMKVTGFSTGICKSGTTTCNSSDSVSSNNTGAIANVQYFSATLPRYSTTYWGIRPTIPVSGTSGSGVAPIWINTDYNPNFSVGDHITVAGLTGNTAANQNSVAITGVQPRQTWWLTTPTPTWPASPTADNLTSIVSNGTTCTVNLTVAHNLQSGWRVLVYSTVNDTESMGDITHGYRYTVTSTPTADTFTYGCPGSTAGTYATDSGDYHMAVVAEPGFSIAGTGNGNYTGETTGTVVATDDTKNFAEIQYSPPSLSSSQSPAPLSCDLNQDGVVNILDVQIMVDEVLGTLPCTSKLDGTTGCDNADVQIVLAAALGGACTIP